MIQALGVLLGRWRVETLLACGMLLFKTMVSPGQSNLERTVPSSSPQPRSDPFLYRPIYGLAESSGSKSKNFSIKTILGFG